MRQNPLLLLSRVGITFVFAKFVSDVLQMTRNMRTEIWIMTDQSELPRLTLSICAELNLSLPEDLDPISMSLRFGPISSQLAELLFRLNFVSESVAFDVPQPIASTYLYLMHQQPCIQLQSRYFSLKGVLYGWRLYNLSGWRVGPHAENQVLFEQSQLFDTPRHNQHRLAWIRLLQLVDKTGLWTANCSYPLVRTPFQRVFTNNMHRTTARQLAAALLNDLFRMHMHSVAEWKKLRAKIDATMLSNIEQKKQQFMSSAVNTDIGMVDKPPGFCECSEWPNPICKVNIIYTQMGYIRNLNMLHTVPKVNNQSVTSVQSMFVIPFFARFQIDSMIGWKLAGVYLISMAATFFGISLLRIQFVVGKFIHRAYELKRIAWLCFFSIWPRLPNRSQSLKISTNINGKRSKSQSFLANQSDSKKRQQNRLKIVIWMISLMLISLQAYPVVIGYWTNATVLRCKAYITERFEPLALSICFPPYQIIPNETDWDGIWITPNQLAEIADDNTIWRLLKHQTKFVHPLLSAGRIFLYEGLLCQTFEDKTPTLGMLLSTLWSQQTVTFHPNTSIQLYMHPPHRQHLNSHYRVLNGRPYWDMVQYFGLEKLNECHSYDANGMENQQQCLDLCALHYEIERMNKSGVHFKLNTQFLYIPLHLPNHDTAETLEQFPYSLIADAPFLARPLPKRSPFQPPRPEEVTLKKKCLGRCQIRDCIQTRMSSSGTFGQPGIGGFLDPGQPVVVYNQGLVIQLHHQWLVTQIEMLLFLSNILNGWFGWTLESIFCWIALQLVRRNKSKCFRSQTERKFESNLRHLPMNVINRNDLNSSNRSNRSTAASKSHLQVQNHFPRADRKPNDHSTYKHSKSIQNVLGFWGWFSIRAFVTICCVIHCFELYNEYVRHPHISVVHMHRPYPPVYTPALMICGVDIAFDPFIVRNHTTAATLSWPHAYPSQTEQEFLKRTDWFQYLNANYTLTYLNATRPDPLFQIKLFRIQWLLCAQLTNHHWFDWHRLREQSLPLIRIRSDRRPYGLIGQLGFGVMARHMKHIPPLEAHLTRTCVWHLQYELPSSQCKKYVPTIQEHLMRSFQTWLHNRYKCISPLVPAYGEYLRKPICLTITDYPVLNSLLFGTILPSTLGYAALEPNSSSQSHFGYSSTKSANLFSVDALTLQYAKYFARKHAHHFALPPCESMQFRASGLSEPQSGLELFVPDRVLRMIQMPRTRFSELVYLWMSAWTVWLNTCMMDELYRYAGVSMRLPGFVRRLEHYRRNQIKLFN